VKRPRRLLVLLSALLTLALAPAAGAAEHHPQVVEFGAEIVDPPPESAAEELAEKYVPITELREETDPPCDTSEEQYQPTSVDTVLGNPTVLLQHAGEGAPLTTVRRAPTAQQIAGLGEGWYLNLQGEALGDTCVYAKAFKQLIKEGKAPAVTYAHIAREAGHPGFALQYWFFWYFNQFNDLHEGDWEGMQLAFEANDPATALHEEPAEIILFQHAGGERAKWEDGKVQKEGTHPIVYPAAGSHATFYDSAVYVENGQHGSGLGCDNTTGPLRELALTPVLMPNRVVSKGPFAWTSYYGRWGEKEKGYNNGPTGPQTKTVWREPFTWMEAQRTTSPRLPGGTLAGPQVTKAFCGAVAAASELINLDAQSPPAAAATVIVILGLITLFVGFTRWRPVDIDTLWRRRALGQILRAARQFYGRHWRVFLPVALAALVLIGVTNQLAGLISESNGRDSSGFHLAWADMLEQLVRPVAQALVAAIVIVVAREALRSREVGFTTALRGVRERFWRVVGAQLLASLGVLLLAISIIGLPWALWKLVGWSFVQQEVIFTDKSFRESFRASSELVRGRWFRTARVVLIFYVIGIATGPMLTFALIFTALPLIWINLIGSLVFALLIPFVAMGETFLFFDLSVREETEPARPHRSWRIWRPRQFGRLVPAPGTAGAASAASG
jgi:DNA-directed RNA polymerase subunit K/omega